MKKQVLFIQGAGEGAYEEDALLAASLQNALGSEYVVRYPKMPEEDSAAYQDWKAQIAAELSALDGAVILVGHSVGGSVLWVPHIFVYHSRDDEVVPFAHLELYASRLPRAVIRVLDEGGHQLWNDLSEVAGDITRTG